MDNKKNRKDLKKRIETRAAEMGRWRRVVTSSKCNIPDEMMDKALENMLGDIDGGILPEAGMTVRGMSLSIEDIVALGIADGEVVYEMQIRLQKTFGMFG